MSKPEILIVQGTTAHRSRIATVAGVVGAAAEQEGGNISTWDLVERPLPIMSLTDPRQRRLPEVMKVRETAARTDGFVIITPEYHGNMSGALKNWFDFLYLELAGKFAGVLAVTGGGGGDMSITSVKNSFSWCHGFTLPFHAAARPDDFDGNQLTNQKLIERIRRIGADVVRYAPLIRKTFESARASGADWTAGVAGMHSDKKD